MFINLVTATTSNAWYKPSNQVRLRFTKPTYLLPTISLSTTLLLVLCKPDIQLLNTKKSNVCYPYTFSTKSKFCCLTTKNFTSWVKLKETMFFYNTVVSDNGSQPVQWWSPAHGFMVLCDWFTVQAIKNIWANFCLPSCIAVKKQWYMVTMILKYSMTASNWSGIPN